LKKDKNGVWKTEDGKQTATDPKLIADLEKLSPAKEPSIIDKAVASLPSFLGGKDASAKTEPTPTPTPTATKNDAKQTKDAGAASDVERGKALDKIIRGVAGDLSGATAADKRDEYYRQQLEKAKQEKAERDRIEASKAEKKPEEPAKKIKAKKAKSTKKADQPRGGSALASAEREPDTVTIIPAPPSPVAPPVADKIDVKDLTTDQAGLAAAKTDTKVDQNAELVSRKQAEENQRRQEAERKAAEARAQAEADRLAAQARAQQELEANRQAEIERAKKAAPIQQTAQQDSGSGFKNMWDKGIEAFTGKQRVNLRDPRITLPESINTELQEILRLAGKKTKE
jgi:colicin import membrane protein